MAFNYVERNPIPRMGLDEPYSFIRYNKNVIYKPQENTLEHFYHALDSLVAQKRKKVNIVHFGDSHIQADFWSDRIRNNFSQEAMFGNGGRGYIFPCSMIKSTDPYNLKVSYTGTWQGTSNINISKNASWGLAGMVSQTTDSNATFTIDINTRSIYKYKVSRVKVYYRTQDATSYQVKLVLKDTTLYPQVLSSLGYAEFHFPATQDKITFQLEKNYPMQNQFVLEGLSFENDEVGVQYHAVGVNGASVFSFLRSPKIEDHLQSLQPDLIIISLGTNDAYTTNFQDKTFKMNFAKLIQRIKKACPQTSILLTTPGDCALAGGWNYNNQVAGKRILELADETNSAVWDLFTIMGGLGSVNKWLANGLSAYDKVHLTGKGYRLQGDLLYDALTQDYAFYRFHQRNLTKKN
ncbi:MAG: GDSL-type esterase/lipase family protein [Microscillaceae bacterium]|nr:GDSL-type esterase/lipase family protein [Microscillaceae bacterium]MDW8460032.1 GDSL-type esterase/lipase family protein [Cytophagales bacterium]